MNPYVFDHYPVNVELPDGTSHRDVLVVVDDERMQVWRDAWPSPVLVMELPHQGFTRGTDARYPATRHQVELAGGIALVGNSTSCGCGSQMRSWRPDVPHRTASRG